MASHRETPTDPNRVLPPFAALRAFDAVFRTGGIRKAASSLGLNHAVVSRHIRSLEDWVGLPLVARNGNRLTLTEDGSRYHARISAAFAEMVLATEELGGRRDNAPLRLSCVPGLAIQWLSHQLAEFERSHPGARVELKPTDAPSNLSIHETDADIRYYRDNDRNLPGGRGLRCFELARPEILAVTSSKLAAELQEADVLDWPLLHEENDCEWRAWLSLSGLQVRDNLPGLLCWHAHLAIAAAREGRGVALASRFLIDADLREGTLAPLSLPGVQPVVLGAYVLIAREDRWTTPILAKLREFLRMRAAELAHGHHRARMPNTSAFGDTKD
jgi:DNA-binding transcriptional LysR family regulator